MDSKTDSRMQVLRILANCMSSVMHAASGFRSSIVASANELTSQLLKFGDLSTLSVSVNSLAYTMHRIAMLVEEQVRHVSSEVIEPLYEFSFRFDDTNEQLQKNLNALLSRLES